MSVMNYGGFELRNTSLLSRNWTHDPSNIHWCENSL